MKSNTVSVVWALGAFLWFIGGIVWFIGGLVNYVSGNYEQAIFCILVAIYSKQVSDT